MTVSGPLPQPRLIILLKAARGYHLVDVRTILFAQAEDKYSRVTFIDSSRKGVFHTLTELEAVLGCGRRNGDLLFLRSHRGCIVAVHHATELIGTREFLVCDGTRLPVSKGEWPTLLEVIASVGTPA